MATSPASAKSATRILATPSGMFSSAETSATDFTSRHRWQMRWCSGSSPMSAAGSAVVLISASMASW
jgi:hypothetical protein